MGKYYNVEENWFFYDTVMVSPWLSTRPHPIPGWYNNFAAIAADNNIYFFNVRNKSIGLAYNNQETQAQLPYAYVVETMSVGYFGPATSSQLGSLDQGTYRGRIDTMSSFWEDEAPTHSAAILRVNQDEIIKANVGMLPPCYGDVGHAMGQGDLAALGGLNGSVTASGQGLPHLKYRWVFPDGIGVPRRATMAVELRLSEWLRDVLGDYWGPGNIELVDTEEAQVYRYSAFLIQVLMTGVREVQQRGAYHA